MQHRRPFTAAGAARRAGKKLEAGKTLRDYGVQHGSTVELRERGRGGRRQECEEERGRWRTKKDIRGDGRERA